MHHIELYKSLAEEAIENLKKLPQPVMRLAGPLTTGGFGYEKNLERFNTGEAVLRAKGYTLFTYRPYEDRINTADYQDSMHADVMTYFHKPIMETGLITEAFFLPRWEESKGATYERELSKKLGVKISEFPEVWLS